MMLRGIEEILGERCCEPHAMNKLQRKNGPRSSYRQQFLVRGSLLIVDDGDDEEDDQPGPNTYWVDQNALTACASTTAAAVLVAVAKRHAPVIASLAPKKKARRQ